ncbi:exodeoxyribonuclease V subunit gamma [Naumannella halotolerans]|uniref:exodeoxyribonuclease V subunit gamma n=1 Tax=Naumannella halotolerans TaxID=993414 RepID=UPI00370D7495
MTTIDASGPRTGELVVHHGPDPEALLDVLARELATPLADPFAFELISVPSQGVERWLSQSLAARLGTSASGGDGIAAGIDYRPLDRLVAEVVTAASGSEDAWSSQRLPWLLLAAMEAARGEPWFAVVADHAWPQGSPRGRAWSVAERLSRLFSGYADQRPSMINAWRRGEDSGPGGAMLPDDRRWQPQLFRLLCELAEVPDPVERLDLGLHRLRRDPDLVDLPQRLAVFGPTRLDDGQLRTLTAIAAHRRLLLFTPHPSPLAWQALASRPPSTSPARAADSTWQALTNPLNSLLGRDSRELQTRLRQLPAQTVGHRGPAPATTLLGRLQADVHDDRAPARLQLQPSDRSIALHRSHGPDRQVEVLREVILGLLSDDPTLEPRDIIVMCPDIEVFAPYIQAAFGLTSELGTHPGHDLRVRLADRSLLQQNPVLATVSEVLRIADSRAGLSEVLDLCASAPVARNFGFDTDDLERIAVLAERAGVRWGLDTDHRRRYAMQGFGQNTWRAGLDRMLLGVAMDGEGGHYLGTALPLDDVDSGDVALIGRLSEFIARLERCCRSLGGPQSVRAWAQALRFTIESLTKVPGSESWQLSHALSSIAELLPDTENSENAPDPDSDPAASHELSLGDLRSLLADAFAGRPSRANFRTGGITMCTLTPMRSVPHRVVCLLGMDEHRFPRRPTADGDDLLQLEPWIGDRDPRSEDRQLLLDAVLSARDQLVIIHSGHSERTGEHRDPCVPVQELTDTIAAMIGDLTAITTEHPLQGFAPANFSQDPPRSFDPIGVRAARAAGAVQVAPPRIWDVADLGPAETSETVDLSELIRFLVHPAKELLRVRAGLSLWSDEQTVLDEIPIELDGLQRWAIGERMLQAAVAGGDLDRLVAAEWRSGQVPPKGLGGALLQTLRNDVEQIGRVASEPMMRAARSLPVSAQLGEREVFGVVPGVRGNEIVSVSYSRLGPKHRLTSWVRLLALTAAEPGTPWQAVTIGKRGRRSVLGPVAAADARARLLDLARIRDLGLGELLPLPLKTAATFAETAARGAKPRPYELPNAFNDERDDVWHLWFDRFGDVDRAPARAVDQANSEPARHESKRFAALARRVWEPLVEAERS